jgi:hypothetical protein
MENPMSLSLTDSRFPSTASDGVHPAAVLRGGAK